VVEVQSFLMAAGVSVERQKDTHYLDSILDAAADDASSAVASFYRFSTSLFLHS
jgi:hypothetical protein